jgi:hypothetical protein
MDNGANLQEPSLPALRVLELPSDHSTAQLRLAPTA